jgi:16S rRNA (uracil1498-N3)-methyltransferase
MPANRYYHPQLFQANSEIYLEGAEQHHLVSVMRTHVGDSVELVNGLGQLAIGALAAIEKKHAKLVLLSVTSVPAEPGQRILAQALPKMARLECILEKATELGVSAFWLFPGAHSEKQQLSQNQLERAHHILISAMKQCGRLFLPEITLKPPLKQWRELPLPAFFGDLHPEAPAAWNSLPAAENLLFFIGPEAGFAEEEVRQLQHLQAKGVKLHNNILRTDTAAIAAAFLMAKEFKIF